MVPVVVLGGHGRGGAVGVGRLPFDMAQPLGCMTPGLQQADGWWEERMESLGQESEGSRG